jgi:hypothetical protein
LNRLIYLSQPGLTIGALTPDFTGRAGDDTVS